MACLTGWSRTSNFDKLTILMLTHLTKNIHKLISSIRATASIKHQVNVIDIRFEKILETIDPLPSNGVHLQY